MKVMISRAVFSTLLLGSSVCQSAMVESPTEHECDRLISSFFMKLNAVERQEQFSHLDIDTQYSVYICGNQKVHPPTVYLAESFSRQGKKIIPFLTDKLLSTKSDHSIRDIVYIFGWMQRLKIYDVASDVALIELINNKTSEIHNEFWREHVKKEVAEIISKPFLQ